MITKEHATETLQMEFGKGSYAIPNVHYLGLSTSAISEDTGMGFTEPTDANYSRKALTNVAATWTTNSAGEVVNAASLEFAAFAANANTPITHWFLSSSATGGKALYYGALTTAYPIIQGSKIVVAAGGLQLCRTNQATV